MNNYSLKPITIQLAQPQESSRDEIRDLMLPVRKDNTTPLDNLISQLVSMGFPLIPAIISYFSYKRNMFVYCGQAPFANSLHCEIEHNQLCIKYIQLIPECSQESNCKMMNENLLPKRVKERKINEVLEKVTQWRKFYNGFTDENGNVIQMQLEQAAQMVGISKKTLDDYLSQIRLGQKFGFDFNKNYEKKIGVLRQFVKRCRGNEKAAQKIQTFQEQKQQNVKEKAKKAQYQLSITENNEEQYPALWQVQNDQLFAKPQNNEFSLYNFNEQYENDCVGNKRNYLEEESASQLELSF